MQRTVPIRHLVEGRGEPVLADRRRHLSVDRKTLIRLRDVALVDAEVDADVDAGEPFVRGRLPLQLTHRLLEQLHVQIETDCFDVTALLRPKQVAGAADLQVERGDPEPAAQLAELTDRGKPTARDRRERVLGRHHEVRVRPAVGATHSSAQLVELRQAVPLGMVDDDRVDVRNVDPVLDDRRRDQDVVAVGNKVDHHPFERLLARLAVRHGEPSLRHETADQVGDRGDRLDAVVHQVDLAAARQLGPDGPRDQLAVEPDDVGLDRQAILRRRLDDRHVADAGKRHVQRAGDRRCRERQHVNPAAQLPDALLVRHAEPLLLVDDQQAEVAEPDILRQQPVRPHHEVHPAGGELSNDVLLLFSTDEPAEKRHADRKRGEPLADRLVVLERQHRGRGEQRHLFAVHQRLERRPKCHLGLAVADVAAKQAVHRAGRLHVALDVGERRLLIGRQLVLERRLEFLLPVRVGAERMARERFARRV